MVQLSYKRMHSNLINFFLNRNEVFKILSKSQISLKNLINPLIF